MVEGHFSPRPSGVAAQECGCDVVMSGFSTRHAVSAALLQSLPSRGETVQVFDPVNKRAYALRFAGSASIFLEHSEVLPTAGLAAYFSAKENGVNKRFFLCKQYQNGKCRAHHNCNSVHACRGRVGELRDAFPPTQQALEADLYLQVLDTKHGELFSVAMNKTERTVGRDLLVRKQQQHGVLCDMYPLCSDPTCPGVHVDVNHMKHIRDMWKQPCCSDATCPGNANPAASSLATPHCELQGFVLSQQQQQSFWNLSALTETKGLRDMCTRPGSLENNTVTLSNGCVYLKVLPGKLCRPHQRKACKWGSECNNLHVCRHRFVLDPQASSWTAGAAPFQPSAASATSSTLTSPATSATSSPYPSPRCSRPTVFVPPELASSLSSFQTLQLPTGGLNSFREYC